MSDLETWPTFLTSGRPIIYFCQKGTKCFLKVILWTVAHSLERSVVVWPHGPYSGSFLWPGCVSQITYQNSHSHKALLQMTCVCVCENLAWTPFCYVWMSMWTSVWICGMCYIFPVPLCACSCTGLNLGHHCGFLFHRCINVCGSVPGSGVCPLCNHSATEEQETPHAHTPSIHKASLSPTGLHWSHSSSGFISISGNSHLPSALDGKWNLY